MYSNPLHAGILRAAAAATMTTRRRQWNQVSGLSNNAKWFNLNKDFPLLNMFNSLLEQIWLKSSLEMGVLPLLLVPYYVKNFMETPIC